jgi:multidrug efflux pump subunit AcrB
VLQVTIAGDLPEKRFKQLADKLTDRLLEIHNIAKVEVTGTREREIWINIDPDKLYGYGFSIEQVAAALGATNLNLPGGTLKVAHSEYLVRTIGEYDRPQDIGNVIVRADPSGRHVKIGHIAQVEDTFEEARTASFFNGRPGVTLNISKKKKGNTIKIVEKIKEAAGRFEADQLPPGCEILCSNDSSIQIKDAIGKLSINALMGMSFVVVLLCLFIGWRNAMFAAIGIPVSLMCTFIFMQMVGGSLNTSSLFGLMMVVGIIVDDAIVIIENCYRYIQKGMKPGEAAVLGTTEVLGPVFSACLTTIAAFLPLMLLPDIMGKFLRVVPIVVCLSLTASLLEAFFILPAHIGEWSSASDRSPARRRLITILRRRYTRLLTFVLKRRYAFVGGVLSVFVSSVALIVVGIIDVDLFTMEEISQFYVNVRMPEGSNLESTNNVLSEIEERLARLPENEVDSLVRNAGLLITQEEWIFNTAVGHVMVDIVEKNKRGRSIDEIMKDCRKKLSDIPGPLSIEFRKLRAGPPRPRDVEVKVQGKYLSELKGISEEIKERLAQIPGVYGTQNDLNFGKKDIKIYVDEDRAALYGLDNYRIASSIRNAYEGRVATVFREGDEEIDVIVKYDPEAVKTIQDIEQLKIATSQGELIPLYNVARIRIEPGYTKIRHFKLDRTATVSADVDAEVNSAVKVNQILQKEARKIIKKYAGYHLRFEGMFMKIKEQFAAMGQLFLMGIFLIYVILGAQFKSYMQPFIILFAIPFTFIGAIAALVITGQPFSLVVIYGFIGLAGIAVNDAIVMLSFINNSRKRGQGRWRSIVEAGRLRLRPIILTSLTTMFGVFPMAVGLGGKSEIWAPMANTIFWGLCAATILTLFIIPCVFTIIIDDLGQWFKKRTGGSNEIALQGPLS